MENIFNKITRVIEGELIEREAHCSICNEGTGKKFAVVDYWNYRTANLVLCPKCNHIQLDPMLNDEETSKGCFAYYIEESLRIGATEQEKNCVRNFRRGVLFGYSLKHKNITPQNVLELGPGSGYFSAGLGFVFPGIEITVMDVNDEVLKLNQEHHNYKTIDGFPDNLIAAYAGKFDLIIARDIIEHVNDISKVLSNVNQYLTPGGYFHFITPNGHEDVWKHYLTYMYTHLESELLINHVHYFDGKGLRDILNKKGFSPVSYYAYNFKNTYHGIGWIKTRRLMNPLSQKVNADLLIAEKAGEMAAIVLNKKNILSKWYITNKAKWIAYVYAIYHHAPIFRADPGLKIGNEIYGLFKKN